MAINGLDLPFDVAFNLNYTETLKSVESADRIEGPKAFAEKRKPNWTGA